ncbi:hypothetical protein [Paractinoplanes durhamensis]|uniref:hypothetical protein n=1 Tax=Paractinoplanes durhamensis TaxID=113563 RepID=UPI0036349E11
MSRFVDEVLATARSATTGMVTGEPAAKARSTWPELHQVARRVAGALIEGGLQPGQAVAVLAGLPAEIAPVAQGIWLAGGSMTMLHQPTPRTDLQVWREDTLRVLTMIDARLVVVGAPFEQVIPVLTAYAIKHVTASELTAGPAHPGWKPSKTAWRCCSSPAVPPPSRRPCGSPTATSTPTSRTPVTISDATSRA